MSGLFENHIVGFPTRWLIYEVHDSISVFALVWLRLNDLFRITFFRCFKPSLPGYYYGKLQCLAPGQNMAKIWVTPGSLAPGSGIRPKSVCNLIPFILFSLLNGEMGG